MNYTQMDDQQILAELGMQNASKELQDTTLAAFWSTVNMRVMMGLGNSLRDDELDQLKAVMESNDADAIMPTISSMVPNAEEWLNGLMSEVIQEIKGTNE